MISIQNSKKNDLTIVSQEEYDFKLGKLYSNTTAALYEIDRIKHQITNNSITKVKIQELEKILSYYKDSTKDKRELYRDYFLEKNNLSNTSFVYRIVSGIEASYKLKQSQN